MMSWITTHFEIVIVVALTLVAAIIILQQRRTPQSAAAWLLFFIVLPWIAVPVFLGLGFRKRSGRFSPVPFHGTAADAAPLATAHSLDDMFQRMGLPGAVSGQDLRLLTTPQDAHAAAMALIADATRTLDVLFYTVTRDDVGEAFLDALAARARDGVRVMFDRLGTGIGPHAALRALREAGAQMHFYSPLIQRPGSGHLNLRNHRKMLIADEARVFSGGMNVGAHYLSPNPPEDHWTDLSFVLEGISVQTFGDVFRSDWGVASKSTPDPADSPPPATAGQATVQLVPSGPDVEEDPLHDGLVRALHLAEERIWIVTPYFVPTEPLGDALSIAARRGVDVRIMVPARSNQRVADLARGGYLRELDRVGAKILYYQPRMIHAKAGIIDGVAYVGSANFDVRSMLLNFETTLFVYDTASVADLSEWYLALVQDCTSGVRPSGVPRRVVEGVFRLGAPVL